MLNNEEEKISDENDFSSIIGSSLRNILENSVTDLVLPYRILSIFHLSSWKTFEKNFIKILKQNLNINEENKQDFVLLNDFHRLTNHLNEKQNDKEDIYFNSLIHSHIGFIPIKSHFHRLSQFID